MLAVAFQDIFQKRRERFAGFAEGSEGAEGLVGETLGVSAAFVDAEEAGVGEFPAGGVFLRAFAGVGGGTLDVDEVVGDLEDEAETAGVEIQAVEEVAVGIAFALDRKDAEFEAGAEEGAGFVVMDVFEGFERVRRLRPGEERVFGRGMLGGAALPGEVFDLPADHAGPAGTSGEFLTTSGGGASGEMFGENLEGEREKAIAGEDGEGFAEFFMASG